MAIDVNLRAVQLKDGSRVISWNDSLHNKYEEKGAENILLQCIFGIFLFAIPIAAVSAKSWTGLILGYGAFFGFFWYLEQPKSISRSLTLNSENLVHRGVKYPLSEIQTVIYDFRGKWDNSQPKLNERTQIRIWLQSNDSIVVGENTWVREINHKIQQTIWQEIQQMQKLGQNALSANREIKVNKVETQKPDDTDDYDIPNY